MIIDFHNLRWSAYFKHYQQKTIIYATSVCHGFTQRSGAFPFKMGQKKGSN